MKRKSIMMGAQAILLSGAVIFFAACNNSDYTKNPAEKTDSASNADTTMNTRPSDTSNSSNAKSSTSNMTNKKMAKPGTAKKNRKVTVGTMSTKTTSKMPDKYGVYEVTDVKPSFPGGHDALESYISNNIDYSQSAVDDNTQGTVDVQFIVDEDGSVMDAKAIGKQVGNGLDDAAVKVISNMPKWTPGKVKGKNVKTRVVLPVTYKMEQ